jgi:hypothetical protein
VTIVQSTNAGWALYERQEMRTGTYFHLKARGRNEALVTVKARSGPGEPYVCLSCRANSCAHTRFVKSIDGPDAGEVVAALVPLAPCEEAREAAHAGLTYADVLGTEEAA